MITKEAPKNSSLFSPIDMLGHESKCYDRMTKDWSYYFRYNVLPILPIDEIEQLYCSNNGRATKDLYTMTALVIFQQFFDLTDNQTCDTLIADLRWQTALNINLVNDKYCYVCPRTLWSFRHKLIENGLDTIIFDTVTPMMAKVNDINFDKQRLDSTHFISNMKKLSRLGVFVKTISTFFRALKKAHKPIFDQIDKNLTDQYIPGKSDDNAYFGTKKPGEAQKTLEQTAKDLFSLVNQFAGRPEVSKMPSFALL
jgi:hypothetical protein